MKISEHEVITLVSALGIDCRQSGTESGRLVVIKVRENRAPDQGDSIGYSEVPVFLLYFEVEPT